MAVTHISSGAFPWSSFGTQASGKSAENIVSSSWKVRRGTSGMRLFSKHHFLVTKLEESCAALLSSGVSLFLLQRLEIKRSQMLLRLKTLPSPGVKWQLLSAPY